MTETRVLAAVRQRVTIKRGIAVPWYVTIEGKGYAHDLHIESVDLVKLRDAGFVIVDPEHYCDLYKVPGLCEPAASQSALDADSAGYGAGVALIGALAGDSGQDYYEEDRDGR